MLEKSKNLQNSKKKISNVRDFFLLFLKFYFGYKKAKKYPLFIFGLCANLIF